MKPVLLGTAGLGSLAIGLALGTLAFAHSGEGEVQAAFVEQVREATARFADIEVALAEGYVPDPSGMCVSAAAEGLPAEWGDMGVHYMRPDLLGITAVAPRVSGTGVHTDFSTPAILLYEPQADGSMELVGVENLVFEAGWRAAGNTEGPVLLDRPWDYMADDPATPGDEAHGFEPHWDQHVWFRENPSGTLMPFNPSVTCANHEAAHGH